MNSPLISRTSSVRFAHGILMLALIFMILEVLWIGKLWSDKMSNEFMITSYCFLIIGSMISQYFLRKSLWGWIFTLLVLFLYSGFSVPEGIEDTREIIRVLFDPGEDLPMLILRLGFMLFLGIPLIAFLLLALNDIRAWSQPHKRIEHPQ